jgi:hypothetical protein
LDTTGLSILDLNSDEYSILHWITILLENRTFDTDSLVASSSKDYLIDHYHLDFDNYDMITGYRADDSYFLYAQDFINGSLPISRLAEAMRLGDPGEQVVLKSAEAFDRLEFMGCEVVDGCEYYRKRTARDSAARNQY